MGQKKIRVVLDTNGLVSALLFSGEVSRILGLLAEGRIVLLVSKDVLLEYARVLAYPKFSLSKEEIRALIEEHVLPFAEIVEIGEVPEVIREDPADDKILELAVAGRARYIVSGDKHLIAMKNYRGIRVVKVAEVLGLVAME